MYSLRAGAVTPMSRGIRNPQPQATHLLGVPSGGGRARGILAGMTQSLSKDHQPVSQCSRATRARERGILSMLCQRCGRNNAPDASVCGSCGWRLVASAMTCPHCREPITVSDRFCRSCGKANSLLGAENILWDETKGERVWRPGAPSTTRPPRRAHWVRIAVAWGGVLAVVAAGVWLLQHSHHVAGLARPSLTIVFGSKWNPKAFTVTDQSSRFTQSPVYALVTSSVTFPRGTLFRLEHWTGSSWTVENTWKPRGKAGADEAYEAFTVSHWGRYRLVVSTGSHLLANRVFSYAPGGAVAAGNGDGSVSTLVPFDYVQGGITVDVPTGWSKVPLQGGDWSGWKFVNPSNPDEEEVIVSSGCVGCYLTIEPNGSFGPPNPSLVIPGSNPTNVFIFNKGLSAGYTFYQPGNPYPGNGVVTVSTDENGYGYVNVVLPSSDQSTATAILNSFQLHL